MDATKEQLSKALAKALLHELNLDRHHFWHPWFQYAAWALVDYSAEQDLEKNRVNY